MFHQVVYKTVPLSMPDYLTLYDGTSGLRITHLDHLSFISHIQHNITGINNLNKSFFFRSHSLWNLLPLEIRQEKDPNKFETQLKKHYWDVALNNAEESDENSLSSSDEYD